MASRGKRRNLLKQNCAYCNHGAHDPDHVPPRCLFATDNRHGIAQVPACSDCHRAFSDDDEYLRQTLVLMRETHGHPDVPVQLLPTTIRALHHPDKQGMFRDLMSGLHYVRQVTPAGIDLGSAPAFHVEMPRIRRSLIRIARGLFYHHRNYRLYRHDYYGVFPINSILRDVQPGAQAARNLCGYLWQQKEHVVGNNVFSYRYSFVEESQHPDPHLSLWYFRFYGTVDFMVATGSFPPIYPPDIPPLNEQELDNLRLDEPEMRV